MSESNKKQGRKFNREKWDWDELNKIKASNDEVVRRFEEKMEEIEKLALEVGMKEQGRSRSRREGAERIIGLAFVLCGGFLVGWLLVELIIKFVI